MTPGETLLGGGYTAKGVIMIQHPNCKVRDITVENPITIMGNASGTQLSGIVNKGGVCALAKNNPPKQNTVNLQGSLFTSLTARISSSLLHTQRALLGLRAKWDKGTATAV